MPNLSDAVLEAGGTIYSRSAKTNRFTELISHDTNDVVQVGAGATSVNVPALRLAGVALAATAGELDALDVSAQTAGALTATADGLTTGAISTSRLVSFYTVTTDSADKIITLPAPTPGLIVILVNGATGYELRTTAPASIAINGGSGADAESAIAASTLVVAVCKSATTWAALSLVGTTLAAVEAAA